MKRQIIGIALASSIILSGGMTKVYADSVPITDVEEMQQYINKIDFLYVIDKDQYKKMMEKDVALFSIKDHLLIIDSENITEEEELKLKSSEEFFIVGDTDNKLESLKSRENFSADLLGKDRSADSVKYAIEHSKEKDIVIANSDSLADSLTALQISKVGDKALILIEDELSNEVKNYIRDNGAKREISFIEGEKTIDDKIKRGIMKLAKNNSYELNKEQFIKSGSLPIQKEETEETQDIEVPIDEKVESETVLEEFNPNMSAAIKTAANKSIEGNKNNFNGKEKTISLEIGKESDVISDIITSESVDVVKNNEKKADEILKAKKDEGFSVNQISITNSNPVEKDELVKLRKEKGNYYIVPKEIDKDIIKRVKDGEYGNGPERKELLTLDGYDYDKIQAELKKIADEERKQREEAERLERERIEKELAKQREAEQAKERQAAEEAAGNDSYVSNNGGNSTSSTTGSESSTSRPGSTTTGPVMSAPVYENQSTDSGSVNVERFLSALTSMQGWTYSQPKRMQYGYADCSSIILRAMLDAGITSSHANMTTRTIFNDSRFYEIPFSEARRGDILWAPGHVEVYMGGNTTFGAFKPGTPSGYSSGKNRFQRAARISGF